jgi:hypothetical protein
MTMQTDKLIQALAADHDKRSRSLVNVVALALIIAAPFSVGMFAMRLGIRPDIATVSTSPFFLLKFATTIALLLAAGLIAMRLARPAQPVGLSWWLLVLPLILLAAGIIGDLSIAQSGNWAKRMIGNNARVCVMAIPMLSLPFLVAALIALRQGASTRPAVTGAAAGLFASAIGATLYAAHCGDDSPLFVAVWYVIAVAIVAGAGALAGKWLLRF